MPILYGAMNFPVRPLLAEVEAVTRLAFDYLELAMDAPEADCRTVRALKPQLKARLADGGLGLVCHLPTFVSPAHLVEGIRRASLQELLHSLEVARELEALKVVLHPAHADGLGLFLPERVQAYRMEALAAMAEHARVLGLPLCLENMFPHTRALVTPQDFAPVLERFPDLNITLDTGHAHIADPSGAMLLDFIRRFPERITHIHASDNFGREDSHLPAGAGSIDFPALVAALVRVGYSGTITCEVFSRDRTFVDLTRRRLQAMFADLRATVP